MTAIYHITHVDNLCRIVADGRLHCDAHMHAVAAGQTRIGHAHIKERRLRTAVPVGPRGTVGEYVPFYFAPRCPMLYAIRAGAVGGYAEGQAPIVHLVGAAEAVAAAGMRFAFTDGHPTMLFTTWFDDLQRLDRIDWPLMASRYWFDTNTDPDRKRRRQAEFLVHGSFPWRLIEAIGVHDTTLRERVESELASAEHRPPVSVQAGWYY